MPARKFPAKRYSQVSALRETMSPGVQGVSEQSFFIQDREFFAGHLLVDLSDLRWKRIPAFTGTDDEPGNLRLGF